MKIRNRQGSETLNFHGVQVVTTFYFQYAKFEVEKHRFKQLL